ncbi:uncharacterized protein BXZ73DRAFT_105836 [Epithele typhae]|uniref:uncharacterized protein n=1 Tax=Epithele typhae TaxID=378194 RepID=UPI002008BD7D|nr:uncharacterized protein BXZ73DRAFT_105836 [Epithele typhae]KAH9916398.1 hypothetical protein BXZ73DRAFT_105836 [Epithele typhae]
MNICHTTVSMPKDRSAENGSLTIQSTSGSTRPPGSGELVSNPNGGSLTTLREACVGANVPDVSNAMGGPMPPPSFVVADEAGVVADWPPPGFAAVDDVTALLWLLGFMKTIVTTNLDIPQLRIARLAIRTQAPQGCPLVPVPPRREPSRAPLNFDLEVVEHQPPTPDQLRTILSYLPAAPGLSALLSAHPTVDSTPATEQGVSELAERNPNALKWPIVVDWHAGRAAVGDVDAVKALLEELRKKRDGEA